ncbi:MAG: hypothetical protein JO051_11230 [Acidobacteriaceae bacterium]|jgi:uncharacterized paraquat-inducible protein A|nr:hypothetical protein [Acidobacteriaceae bacterium]
MTKMTSCPACGAMMSTDVGVCPRCGAVLSGFPVIPVGIAAMLVIAILYALFERYS